jgi:hypothetical protein
VTCSGDMKTYLINVQIDMNKGFPSESESTPIAHIFAIAIHHIARFPMQAARVSGS